MLNGGRKVYRVERIRNAYWKEICRLSNLYDARELCKRLRVQGVPTRIVADDVVIATYSLKEKIDG